MTAFGVLAFVLLLFVPAPYGRYQSVSGRFYSLGLPDVPGPVAWLLQECPAFFCFVYQWYASSKPDTRALTPNTVLLLAFAAHYFNRSFIFPLRLVGGKSTPVGVFLMALVFCVWNGTAQGAYLASVAKWDGSAAEAMLSPRFVGGVLLGALGALVNLEADAILRGLRKPGDTGYYIPRGGAFELVSGANFFGEILEWSGFAIAAYAPLQGLSASLNALQQVPLLGLLLHPAVAFAVFTFCNIAPRGAQHHASYKQRFGDAYPAHRKAVIPFIW